MNNKIKILGITFLVLILSILSFNINVKAETHFKGAYPIRESYKDLKFYSGNKKDGTKIILKLKNIGLYYQESGSNYEELFCLEPGTPLNPYTLDSLPITPIDKYSGTYSEYEIKSLKKDLLKKIISIAPQLGSNSDKISTEISRILNLIGETNINKKNSVVIKDSATMDKLEGIFATQAVIWEIISGERTSFSSYKPENAKTGKTSGVYNSFYAMINSESGLSNLKKKYENLIDLARVTYENKELGSSCIFKSSSPYNGCKLSSQSNGTYILHIVDPNFKYFNVASSDADLKVSLSGDTLTILSYNSISPSNAKTIKLSVKPINKPAYSESNMNYDPINVFENKSNQDLVNIRSIYAEYAANFYTDDTQVDEGTYHLRVQKLGGKTFATQPLEGAAFKIYKCPPDSVIGLFSCGASVRTPVTNNEVDMVSDSNGYASYENLPSAGKYAVVEVKAPDGYKKDNVNLYIDVTKKSSDKEYDKPFIGTVYKFNNYEETETPEYQIKIIKIDSKDGHPLKGATFEIEKLLSSSKITAVTDENGEAVVTLSPGEYIFNEINPPEGYAISEKSGYNCNLCYDPNSILCLSHCEDEIIFTNDVLPDDPDLYQLKFVKYGKISSESESYFPLEGVSFNLYESDKKTIVSECDIITDENGIGKCTNISKPGTYYLKENKAPAGYKLNSNYYKVVIGDEHASGSSKWAIPDGDDEKTNGIIYNLIDVKPEVNYMAGISKYSSLNSDKIKGSKFNLLDEKYNVIDECKSLETNINGIATCSSLNAPGTYYFQEVEAAPGYIIDKNYIPIVVGQSDTVTNGGVKVGFSNKPTTGKLIKYTIDETGKKIKLNDGCGTNNYTGPAFEIKDLNGKKLYFSKYKDGEYVLSDSSNGNTEVKTCNGEFKVYALPKGEYVISETKQPDGRYYKADDQKIIISDAKEVNEIVFDNVSVTDESVSVINFNKKNENGEVIPNGIFVLQRKENGKYIDVKLEKNGEVYKYTTDSNVTNYQIENGSGTYLITDVPMGEYRIVERQAPEGYKLIKDVNSKSIVTINESGKQYYVEMVDRKSDINGSSSSAELIITISTGRKVLNYVLIISGLALILTGLIIIRKKIKK